MKNPMIDAIPAWYEIDLEKDRNDTFIIRIHNTALAEFKKIKTNAPILLHYQKTMELPEFIGPGSEYWGFGKVFREIPCELSDWTAHRARLPVVKGPRKKERSDWSELGRLRATLDVLFSALWLFDGGSGSQKPQLIIINTMAAMGNGAISATITPAMIDFLAKYNERTIREVANAMRWTDEYMYQEETNSYHRLRFHAYLEENMRLHLSVPGDACGLDPESFFSSSLRKRGYCLTPHNVDNGIQQMSFLRGLARLHSLARQSGM